MNIEVQRVLLALVTFVVTMCPLSYIWIFKRTNIKTFRSVDIEKMFYKKNQSGHSVILASRMGNYTFSNIILAAVIISIFSYGLGNYPTAVFFVSLFLWVPMAIRMTRNIYTVIFVTSSNVYVYNAIRDTCNAIGIDSNTKASVITNTLTQTLAINGNEVCKGLELLNSPELAFEINKSAAQGAFGG